MVNEPEEYKPSGSHLRWCIWHVYNALVGRRDVKRFNYPVPIGKPNRAWHPRAVFVDMIAARYRAGKDT